MAKISKAIHCVAADQLSEIWRRGLQQGEQGAHSRKPLIAETNARLDELRPAGIVQAGLSRERNLYLYLYRDGHIKDITDGTWKDARIWIRVRALQSSRF